MIEPKFDQGVLPFFAEDELARFSNVYGDRSLRDLGKLVLRVKNAEQDSALAEHFSSLYLLTNFLLMSRARKLILKIVQLEATPASRPMLYAQINALRYLLLAEHSALDNFAEWQAKVESYVPISDHLTKKLKAISDFLAVSEITKANSNAQLADTMLSFYDGESFEDQGIHITDSTTWQLSLAGDGVAFEEVLNQAIYGDAFSVHISSNREVLLIDVDAAKSEVALKEWMVFLENLFADDPLGLSL